MPPWIPYKFVEEPTELSDGTRSVVKTRLAPLVWSKWVAELQDVAAVQGRVVHRLAVQEGPVAAAEVAHPEGVAVRVDLGVDLGHVGRRDPELDVGAPPDAEGQRADPRALQGLAIGREALEDPPVRGAGSIPRLQNPLPKLLVFGLAVSMTCVLPVPM